MSVVSEPLMNEPLMRIRDLTAGYGRGQVLFGIDLDLPPRGGLAILGRNGAGKTTLLRTLIGELESTGGTISLDHQSLVGRPPDERVRHGIGYVPQERSVFTGMTVRDNLKLGLMGTKHPGDFDKVFAMFPKLSNRLDQIAGTLSGGERKMLAIARALLGEPRVLLLDEPTEGVWIGVIDEIADRLKALAEQIAVVIVEQHLDLAWRMASKACVMDRGKFVLSGDSADVRDDPRLLTYLAP